MISPKSVNFGRAATDYGQFRVGFPQSLFARLDRFEIGVHEQRVLDLGTGTGTMARGFASRGCRVTACDKSQELIDEAQKLDQRAGLDIEYVVGRAEKTGLPAGSFEGVSAGQCWHWFNRSRAVKEVRRVLVGGGWLLIAHFDWLPLKGNVVRATEKLIRKYNPRWDLDGSTGIHDEWLTDVRRAGFVEVETFSFDLDVPYSHEGWRGRVRASSGVGASLRVGKAQRFDESLRVMLAEDFPQQPLQIPHCVWALVCRKPKSE